MSIFYTDTARKQQPCYACRATPEITPGGKSDIIKGNRIVRIAVVGERYARAFHYECAIKYMEMETVRIMKDAQWDPNFKRKMVNPYRAERKMRVKADVD